MKLKNAASRLASARTACEKAEEILEVLKSHDEYLEISSDIAFVQRQVLQLQGQADMIHKIITNLESVAELRAESLDNSGDI